jgi:hypothetical protein
MGVHHQNDWDTFLFPDNGAWRMAATPLGRHFPIPELSVRPARASAIRSPRDLRPCRLSSPVAHARSRARQDGQRSRRCRCTATSSAPRSDNALGCRQVRRSTRHSMRCGAAAMTSLRRRHAARPPRGRGRAHPRNQSRRCPPGARWSTEHQDQPEAFRATAGRTCRLERAFLDHGLVLQQLPDTGDRDSAADLR